MAVFATLHAHIASERPYHLGFMATKRPLPHSIVMKKKGVFEGYSDE
jgi:hypothetical protein